MRIEYTYTHDFIAAFNKAYDGVNIMDIDALTELRRIAESWLMPPEQRKPYIDLIQNAIDASYAHSYGGD